MSRLGIQTGSNPNDGQGDPLRVAMGKINSNFTEIYNTLGDGNDVISYASTAGISTLARNLTGSPRINVSSILNTGITTTEHIEVRNITSTGVVTATQFVGDGSQLTNVTALVGGLEVLDDNVRKGVARELNFGANIQSTGPDGVGRVTISVSTVTSSSSAGYAEISGISTLSQGLVGTPNLNVGVITATDVLFNRIGISSGEINVGYNNSLLINMDGPEGSSTYTFGNGGILSVPGNVEIGGGGGGGYVLFNNGGSKLQAEPTNDFEIHVGGFANKVTGFGTDGSLTVPGTITFPNGTIQSTAFIGYANTAGIATYSSSSGIASGLTSTSSVNTTGIITASRFESTSAGTPTIDSPNNLNINAVTVAISTDLTVGGDAYVGVDTSSGLILTSPNGTQYRLVVDNSGNLSTVLVP